MEKASHHHSVRRRVEFSETDSAGLVHFSNYFRWMEFAEADYFRQLGITLFASKSSRGFPRVRAECQYSEPLAFEDLVEIQLSIEATTGRSITYAFRFLKVVPSGLLRVAKGRMTTVFVERLPNGKLQPLPLPEVLHLALSEATPEAKPQDPDTQERGCP